MIMEDPSCETGIQQPASFGESVESFEAGLGMVAAGVLTAFLLIGILAVTIAYIWQSPSLLHKTGIGAAGVLLIAVEVGCYAFILRAMSRTQGSPLLNLARGQPAYPLLIRPLVATWWAAHFAGMAISADALVESLRFFDSTTYERYAIMVIQFLIVAGTSFSANAYLLLAAGALTQWSRLMEVIYRWRYLIDLIVAVILTLVPLDLHRLRLA